MYVIVRKYVVVWADEYTCVNYAPHFDAVLKLLFVLKLFFKIESNNYKDILDC